MPAKKVVQEPTVDTVPEVSVEVESAEPAPLAVITQKVADMMALGREITALLKTFQKSYDKVVKSKTRKAPAAGGAKRTPSGFNKPAKLSPELCAFLGIPEGSEMARTHVTRQLNVYIKEQNLQNPENKKQIVPDEKLKALLNLPADQQLSYFNLQRFMKHLFI